MEYQYQSTWDHTLTHHASMNPLTRGVSISNNLNNLNNMEELAFEMGCVPMFATDTGYSTGIGGGLEGVNDYPVQCQTANAFLGDRNNSHVSLATMYKQQQYQDSKQEVKTMGMATSNAQQHQAPSQQLNGNGKRMQSNSADHYNYSTGYGYGYHADASAAEGTIDTDQSASFDVAGVGAATTLGQSHVQQNQQQQLLQKQVEETQQQQQQQQLMVESHQVFYNEMVAMAQAQVQHQPVADALAHASHSASVSLPQQPQLKVKKVVVKKPKTKSGSPTMQQQSHANHAMGNNSNDSSHPNPKKGVPASILPKISEPHADLIAQQQPEYGKQKKIQTLQHSISDPLDLSKHRNNSNGFAQRNEYDEDDKEEEEEEEDEDEDASTHAPEYAYYTGSTMTANMEDSDVPNGMRSQPNTPRWVSAATGGMSPPATKALKNGKHVQQVVKQTVENATPVIMDPAAGSNSPAEQISSVEENRRRTRSTYSRRCRQKLNDLITVLFSKLPELPADRSIRHKHEILEYAIEVLDRYNTSSMNSPSNNWH